MCKDFSYIADNSRNIYRHSRRFRGHSHTRIFASLFPDKFPQLWGLESEYVRYEDTLYHGIKLDEDIVPKWCKTSARREIEKYGRAARNINWKFKNFDKTFFKFKLIPDERHNTIKICRPTMSRRWLDPYTFKNREAFRKACAEQKIPTRLADLVYSTPADVMFGKLNKEHLKKYL